MPDYRLRIGMRFIKQGREYVIERRLGDGKIRIRDTARDICVDESIDGLVNELFAGKLELVGEENYRLYLNEKLGKTRITDLSQLTDDDPQKFAVVRRLHYVKALIKSMPCARTQAQLAPVIQRASQKIDDPHPPSWVTLNRWFRAYESGGRDIRSLFSSHKARGNRKQKISGTIPTELTEEDYEKAQAVSAIVDRVIRTKFLTLERPTVQSVHETIIDRISVENRYREPPTAEEVSAAIYRGAGSARRSSLLSRRWRRRAGILIHGYILLRDGIDYAEFLRRASKRGHFRACSIGIDSSDTLRCLSRVPVVFTRPEVTELLSRLSSTYKLIAGLLYGSGPRRTEASLFLILGWVRKGAGSESLNSHYYIHA